MSASVNKSLKPISVPRKQSTISFEALFSQSAPCVSVPCICAYTLRGMSDLFRERVPYIQYTYCMAIAHVSRSTMTTNDRPPISHKETKTGSHVHTYLVVQEDPQRVLAEAAHRPAPDLARQLLPVDPLRPAAGDGLAALLL